MQYLNSAIPGGGIDLEEIIVNWWNNISPLSKKSFLWIFLITNVVFLFHTTQWLWGNHDWGLVKSHMNIYDMLWCGRFTGGLIQQIFGGDLLPVINNVFCFAGFTFGVIYLAKYWKIPQTFLCYTLFGLFIILMPYTCAWLWYVKQTSLYWNIFFVVLGLKLSLDKSYIKSIFAIFLFVISLGAYASIISTIGIVFLGRVLIDVMLEDKTIKQLFKNYLRTGINVIISVIIFKLILMYYDSIGKMRHGASNTDYVILADFSYKLASTIVTIKKMFHVSQPFISSNYKLFILLPIFLTLAKMMSLRTVKIMQSVGILFMILLCTQLTHLISKSNDFAYCVRVNFFSYPYLWALFIAIGLKNNMFSKSFCLIIMIVTLWLNILSDIRFQKVFYLGLEAELQIYTDIINRIKRHDNYDNKKVYTLINTAPKALRKNFYYYNDIDKKDSSLLDYSFVTPWKIYPFYNFYSSSNFIRNSWYISSQRFFPKRVSYNTLKQISNFILNKAKPYPHKDSVYVDDKYIYVIYDEKGLEDAKRNLRNRLKELEKNNDK